MKKAKFLSLLFMTVFLSGVASTALANEPVAGNVVIVRGVVTVARAGSTQFITLKPGDSIFERDTIKTGINSRVQIALIDNSTIFVSPESTMQIKQHSLNYNQGKRSVVVKAFIGRIRLTVLKVFKVVATGATGSWGDSNFSVETPTAIAGIRGTDFVVTVSPTHTNIVVFEGLIGVRNISALIRGEVAVGANQTSTVKKDAPPKVPAPITPQQRETLIRETTPEITAKQEVQGSEVASRETVKDEIVRDVASGTPIRDVLAKLIDSGMNVDEAVASLIEAGGDGSIIYLAITEGYSAQLVVKGALKSCIIRYINHLSCPGTSLNVVVQIAIKAGADAKEIAQGAVDAGVPPSEVASAVSTTTTSEAPVFGYTAPVEAVSESLSSASATSFLTGGGGATPSASPSAP